MRAAFYECDITPPLGENMPGYYRANPAEDVLERIYAKGIENCGELSYYIFDTAYLTVSSDGLPFLDVKTKVYFEKDGKITEQDLCSLVIFKQEPSDDLLKTEFTKKNNVNLP
jgi:hypothetical protein